MVEGRATEFWRQAARALHVQRGTPRAEMSAARPPKRVLVVDDEPEIVRLLKDVFASFRHAHVFGDVEAPVVVLGEGGLLEGYCRTTKVRSVEAASATRDTVASLKPLVKS
jgi:hypothetical protein